MLLNHLEAKENSVEFHGMVKQGYNLEEGFRRHSMRRRHLKRPGYTKTMNIKVSGCRIAREKDTLVRAILCNHFRSVVAH